MIPEPTYLLIGMAFVVGLIAGFGMGVGFGADRWKK